MKLRHLFSKETDRKTEAILSEVSKTSQDTAASAKRLEKLLKQNGVSFQILIATGADTRHS